MNFWKDAEHVTLHAVRSSNEVWPTRVRSLSECLPRRLPRWVTHGPHPFVSGRANSLSTELLQRRPVIQDTQDDKEEIECPDVPGGDLRRFFDVALSTTATLRSLLQAESQQSCTPNSKESLLSSIIAYVMFLSSPGVLIFDRARFALPRHPKVLVNPVQKYTKTTSTATLVVGYTADDFPQILTGCSVPASTSSHSRANSSANLASGRTSGPEQRAGIEASDASGSRQQCVSEKPVRARWHASDYDRPYMPSVEYDPFGGGSGDKDSCPVGEEAALDCANAGCQDGSLDIHMFPGAALTDTPVIPVICMAGPEDIYGLVASALYQRHVWRTHAPVVGLTFPAGGAAIQVIFGWLEDGDSGSSEDVLPRVHIAFQSSPCDASSSVFDLCDPGSTLKLCLFLLSLGHHVSEIGCALSDASHCVQDDITNGTVLQWRSDLLNIVNNEHGSRTEESIAAWAQQVAIALESGEGVLLQDMPPASDKKTESSARTPELQLTKPGTSKSESLHPDSAIPSSASGSGSQQPKRLSCSECAANSKESSGDTGRMDDWLAYRLSLPSFLPILQHESASVPVNMYEKFTRYYWPAEWTVLKNLPSVGEDLEGLRRELFCSNQAREEHVKYGRAPTPSPMPNRVTKMIEAKLALILRACFRARHRRDQAESRQVPEAEVRPEWDNLLIEFMRAKNDTVAQYLERRLNLPKNEAAVAPDKDALASFLSFKVLPGLAGACTAAQSSFEEMIIKEGAPKLYSDASHSEAGQQSQQMQTLFKYYLGLPLPASYQKKSPRVQADSEPLTGTCDAVAILHLPQFLPADTPPMRDFQLVDLGTRARSLSNADSQYSAVGPSQSEKNSSTDRTRAARSDKALQREVRPNVQADLFAYTRNEAAYTSGIEAVFERMSISQPPAKRSYPAQQASARGLDVPLLVAEYKKLSDEFSPKGVNQARMYSVATAKFFSALGIEDFPVFALVAEGSLGVVTCTHSDTIAGPDTRGKITRYVKMLEANARSFDIATPIGAFHFATFLCLLATEYADEVGRKLEEVKGDFIRKYKNSDPSLRWNMKQQI